MNICLILRVLKKNYSFSFGFGYLLDSDDCDKFIFYLFYMKYLLAGTGLFFASSHFTNAGTHLVMVFVSPPGVGEGGKEYKPRHAGCAS